MFGSVSPSRRPVQFSTWLKYFSRNLTREAIEQSNDVEPVEDNNETIEQIEIPTIGETSETKEENNSSLEADVNKILSNNLKKAN